MQSMLTAARFDAPHTYAFGPFLLDARHRVLRHGNTLRPLPEKLFKMLVLLIEADGQTVTRDEFLANVWPSDEATDGNLKQHIFMLRGVLGEHAGENRYIVTVPRGGYRLAAPVERKMGLVMKQTCERCRTLLEPDGVAFICSFECTYCAPCADALEGACMNCGGELVARPRRLATKTEAG
jgi:uncharacterized protein